jgi:hypothetical protein
LNPFSAKLVQFVEDPGLETLQNYVVGALYLAIGMWVCDSCPIHADVVVVAKLQELLASKQGAIVGDDGVWHPEPVDNVSEE